MIKKLTLFFDKSVRERVMMEGPSFEISEGFLAALRLPYELFSVELCGELREASILGGAWKCNDGLRHELWTASRSFTSAHRVEGVLRSWRKHELELTLTFFQRSDREPFASTRIDFVLASGEIHEVNHHFHGFQGVSP